MHVNFPSIEPSNPQAITKLTGSPKSRIIICYRRNLSMQATGIGELSKNAINNKLFQSDVHSDKIYINQFSPYA